MLQQILSANHKRAEDEQMEHIMQTWRPPLDPRAKEIQWTEAELARMARQPTQPAQPGTATQWIMERARDKAMATKQSKLEENARRLASFTEWRAWQGHRHLQAQANHELDHMWNAGAAAVEHISQVSVLHTQEYDEHGVHCSDLQVPTNNAFSGGKAHGLPHFNRT